MLFEKKVWTFICYNIKPLLFFFSSQLLHSPFKVYVHFATIFYHCLQLFLTFPLFPLIQKLENKKKTAHLLSSERTTLSQLSLTTGWGTQHSWTGITSDSGLGVWENSGDVKTSLTFNIHEEGSWLLNKQLQFVLVSLSSWGWVQ